MDPTSHEVFISLQLLEHFFKPETRHSGRNFFAKGQVTSTRPSDIQVQAYIRGTITYKISFLAESIDSEMIFAECNCSTAGKGQLCKHIWAGLLKTEQNHSDFLEGKTTIEKQSSSHVTSQTTASAAKTKFVPKPPSEAQLASKVAFKEKQNDYRKLQYQKQKLRLQQKKLAQKNKPEDAEEELPFEISRALTFFSTNGFPLTKPFDSAVLNLAKKKLSRIFHPDAGGTHEEILELNKNFELLINYIKIS